MAERKTPNKLMIIVVIAVVAIFSVVKLSTRGPAYSQMNTLPSFDENSQPKDGDTQADTIRALQAYAKEAVAKAQALNEQTRKQQTTVLENQNKVTTLENANKALTDATEKMSTYTQGLEVQLKALESQISAIEEAQVRRNAAMDEHGIPVGFGFDHLKKKRDGETGQWHDPIGQEAEGADKKAGAGFTGLLTPPGKSLRQEHPKPEEDTSDPAASEIEPAFTLAKDMVLYDGVAMTALIGRIPVEGTTPDPYPVKIFVGKENLAANGHELPEVEGMIFSGLGFGDWSLSCVSARLLSATFIFADGSIVNHGSESKPLGYISDRKGWPCVRGTFRTNAPRFLRDRVGLAGLRAAGSAYANAQFSQERSGLTGSTSATFTGDMGKLVGGTVIQSATDEASQWLLDRQKQSFDAVIVDPGADVSVHLEKSLAIDKSPLLRKLRYPRNRVYSSKTLD